VRPPREGVLERRHFCRRRCASSGTEQPVCRQELPANLSTTKIPLSFVGIGGTPALKFQAIKLSSTFPRCQMKMRSGLGFTILPMKLHVLRVSIGPSRPSFPFVRWPRMFAPVPTMRIGRRTTTPHSRAGLEHRFLGAQVFHRPRTKDRCLESPSASSLPPSQRFWLLVCTPAQAIEKCGSAERTDLEPGANWIDGTRPVSATRPEPRFQPSSGKQS
jgi:hypothetical protein